jgi:hypothetical protein
VTVSTREADIVLKTLRKAHLEWLIVSPPTRLEIRAMALVLLAQGDLTLGKTPDEVLAMVDLRFEAVGPILRYIFCTKSSFQERVREQNAIDGQTLIADLQSASLTDVPRKLGMFMGTFLRDSVDVPFADKDCFEWRFLSLARAEAVAILACKTPTMLEALQRFGIKWQVLEAIVQLAVRGDKELDPEFALDKWEWYTNPPHINSSVTLPVAPVLGLLLGAPPNAVSLFPGTVLRRDVRKLRENVVYKSVSYQGKLADLFIFSHEQKKAYLIQVSDRLPSEHAFPINHLTEMHHALQLGKDYTLVYVHVCPQNKRSSDKLKGIVILDDKKQKISLVKARKQLTDINVEAFVVRAPITPGEVPVIYNELKAPAEKKPRNKRPPKR